MKVYFILINNKLEAELIEVLPPLSRECYVRSFRMEDRQRAELSYTNWVNQWAEKEYQKIRI